MGDITARRGRLPLSMRSLLGFCGNCAVLTLCVQGTCGLVSAGESVPSWGEAKRNFQARVFLSASPGSQSLLTGSCTKLICVLTMAFPCVHLGAVSPMQTCCHKAPL